MDGLQLIRLQATQNANIKTVTDEVNEARQTQAGVQHGTLKERLDAMETASTGLDNKVAAVEKEINDAKGVQPTLNDKLTSIENGITAAINGLSWKPTVGTFGELATQYPNAEEGWCANVIADGCLYRYTTGAWIKISSNAIPKADGQTDGLMSKEHFNKLEAMPDANNIITTVGGQVIAGTLEVQGGITGNLTGKADEATTADKVANKLIINGQEYDGSAQVNLNIATADHEHSSDKITAMTGYVKGGATTPITEGDTLNQAIGKLEVALDSKAGTNHAHVGTDVTLTGYVKGGAFPIEATDNVNQAIGKLEAEIDSKADSVHTHEYAGSDTPGGAATSAKKLETPVNIELTGSVTGQAQFDGSVGIQINTALAAGNITLKSTFVHETVGNNAPSVTVTIADYDETKDLLRVYSSGLLLRPNHHYTVNNAGTRYTFTATANAGNEWKQGEEMTFEVIKASL